MSLFGFIGLGFLLFGLAGCGDNSLDLYLKNRKGISQTKAQQLSAARESFVDALAIAPFQPELHLNLGVIDGGLGRVDAAEAGYQNAEHYAANNPALTFAARFNMGEIEGKAKKIDAALKWYQAALAIDPTSLETKTNIELLLGGQGQGEGKDNQENKDNKDQKGDQKQDKKDDKDKDGDKDKPKDHAQNSPKYKPREFKGELSEGDVKKILGEIRQQEKKIRSEFNRREAKERPRDKDW